MKLSKIPILRNPSEWDIHKYTGQDTRLYLFWIIHDSPRWAVNAGVKVNEVPEDIFEPWVFLYFLQGISGEFTLNGSPFQNWRWMPAAQRMARKIGAHMLADELAAAWAEVCTFPEDLLDAYDAGDLIWEENMIKAQRGWPEDRRRSRRIPAEVGERLSYLLDGRWQPEIDQMPFANPIDPPGDSEYHLENGVAAYLSKIDLPFVWHDTKEGLEASITEITDSFDDYEVRLGDRTGPCPLGDLFNAARELQPVAKHKLLPLPKRFSSSRSKRNNCSMVSKDGMLISLIPSDLGDFVAAYFQDKAQLIAADDWFELAVVDLPKALRSRQKAKERLTYEQAKHWRLGEGFRPII